jgi:polyhydroxybutyrate depolymerase
MRLILALIAFVAAAPSFAMGAKTTATLEAPSGSFGRSPLKIYAPKNIAPGERLPLVVLFHGYTGSAAQIDFYFGLSREVENRRFVLAVPEGLLNVQGQRYWNASDGCCDFEHRGVEDVAYVLSFVKDLRARYPIDESRIYAAGHSNGGFLSHRLACEPGNPFAALVSLAGVSALDPAACASKRPVSVLQIHALDDPTINYKGSAGYPGLKAYPGARETVDGWVKRNQCGPKQSAPAIDQAVSIPGIDTDVEKWDCAAGTHVEFRSIRPYFAAWHWPHVPFLSRTFAGEVLDFLYAQRRATP